MIKCEVLEDTAMSIGKGSIVLVSEKQFELARRVLKPLNEHKAEIPMEETPAKEKRAKTKK